MGATRGSQQTVDDQVSIGAFGWPERPQRITTCPQAGCDARKILPTDLYCASHDRFLPFVRHWTSSGRVTGIVAGTTLVYGCFALSAQLNSWVPVYIVYALIGLAAVGLPLRLFPLALHAVIPMWFAACAGTVIYHFTGPRSHAIMVTALIIVTAVALGLHFGTQSVEDALYDDETGNTDRRPRGALAFVTGTFAVSVAAGAAALGLLAVPGSLLINESLLMRASVIAAAGAAALGLLGALVAGFVDGGPRVSMDTPAIAMWRGPEPVRWRARRALIRPRRTRTIVDRMAEVSRRALIRLADALCILAVASARTIVNIMFTAARLAANGITRCVNLILRLIILLCRFIAAGLTSAWWSCSNAVEIVIPCLLYTVIAAVLPVAALVAAAGLTILCTDETRLYLITGSLGALAQFGGAAALGIVALAVTWITLASQHVRHSLQSAYRSAVITGPYALLLVTVGGWIIGLFGTFGPGRIHVGWVTSVSTALLIIAFVWSQFISKAQDDSGPTPATPSSHGKGSNQRDERWGRA